jgi:hypothetical protein
VFGNPVEDEGHAVFRLVVDDFRHLVLAGQSRSLGLLYACTRRLACLHIVVVTNTKQE